VRAARVLVDGETVGEVGRGVCVLLGIAVGDGHAEAARLSRKVALLRIFENDEGKFDRSLQEIAGAALVVSQFTLIADTAKGNRPSFGHAADADTAEPIYDAFCTELEGHAVDVARGVFGARMIVEIENDGPVTILLET
jgi:D-tyrosyl-tRNA(Tyr) deacylase